MKRIFRLCLFCLGILPGISLYSCADAGEDAYSGTPPAYANGTQMDALVGDFAAAVSTAVRQSPEFRKVIHAEVLKQFDGDYDLLLSQAAGIGLGSAEETRNGTAPTVKELLESCYPGDKMSRASSPIEELQELYPLLQISVPVHAEEWDPESYTPVVCFVPSDYVEHQTTSVPGIDAEGNRIEVDAVNEPKEPVIVVGMNERLSVPGGGGLTQFEVLGIPSLSGVYQGGAVRLSWSCISFGIREDGYIIYRAGPNNSTDFTRIATVSASTKSFVDWNTVSGKEYVYKVASYKGFKTATSDTFFITTDYTKPKMVEKFIVRAIGKRRIELMWNNPAGENYTTRIERLSGDNNTDYEVIAELDPNRDSYLDTDIVPGVKYTYVVRKIDHQGRVSDKVRDFAYATYRNPDGPSSVYLKQITCDLKAVESWIGGKPEFYLQASGVKKEKVDEENVKFIPIAMGNTCDVQFASASGISQIFNHTLIHNWSYFNDTSVYPALTFTLIEYDVPSKTFDISINVQAGYKLADVIELGVAGKVDLRFPHSDKHCGNVSILYFENPECWIDFPNYGAQILISERP